MKYLLIFAFQIALINTLSAQSFKYSFAGKDKTKSRFTCHQKMMIRMQVLNVDAEQIEYKVTNKSGELKKLNNFIYTLTANSEKENVIIQAYNKTDKSNLGKVIIPVRCPEDIQVKLFGKFDGDTMDRRKLSAPIKIEVIDKNHPRSNFEIDSFKLSYIKNGKIFEFKFNGTESQLAEGIIERASKLDLISKFFVTSVKVKNDRDKRPEVKNLPVQGMVLVLK